jgi:hypothetical protein
VLLDKRQILTNVADRNHPRIALQSLLIDNEAVVSADGFRLLKVPHRKDLDKVQWPGNWRIHEVLPAPVVVLARTAMKMARLAGKRMLPGLDHVCLTVQDGDPTMDPAGNSIPGPKNGKAKLTVLDEDFVPFSSDAKTVEETYPSYQQIIPVGSGILSITVTSSLLRGMLDNLEKLGASLVKITVYGQRRPIKLEPVGHDLDFPGTVAVIMPASGDGGAVSPQLMVSAVREEAVRLLRATSYTREQALDLLGFKPEIVTGEPGAGEGEEK